MELRHLRYFIAVAEEENVSRAALRLHVSQPGLSRQVRDLEDELGFPLLERSAKSVRLTTAGRVFLEEARAVVQRAEDAVRTVRAIATGGRGELHVGYAPSPTVRILSPTLRAFQSELPNVRVKLHDMSTEEMLAGLGKGKLQLALMVRPTPAMLRGLRFKELRRENMCIAVPPKHPFARQRLVKLAEVAQQPFVVLNREDYPDYHLEIDALFSGTKLKPRIAEEHDSITSLVAAVEAGAGVAMVSESLSCIVGPRLKLIPLTPAARPIVVGAAWPQAGLSPAAERFLECARRAGNGEESKP